MFDRLRAAARETEAALAELDPDSMIGTQPARCLVIIRAQERALAAKRLALVARAEQMHPWQRDGYRSLEEWLAATEGTSPGKAGRKARTARQVTKRPKTAKALEDGEISEDQADTVADAADQNPAAEDQLLDTAKNPNKGQDELADRAAAAKAAAEDDRARARRLRRGRRAGWGTDRDGFWTLHGKLEPHVGAELQARLEAETDWVFQAARRHGERESLGNYRADALANLVNGQKHRGSNNGTTRTDDGLDAPDPADDGTNDPADQTDPPPGSDPGSRHGDADLGGPDRPRPVTQVHKELVLVVDLAAYRRGCVRPGETCEIRGVGAVPVEIARRWADDAFIKTVIRDGRDVNLVTHHGRHVPTHLRTALKIEGAVCSVPGCGNPRVEYDHARPHADQGPTSKANLRPLCVHHHRQRTHHDYELTGRPGDRRWTGPDGTILAADDPTLVGVTITRGSTPPGPTDGPSPDPTSDDHTSAGPERTAADRVRPSPQLAALF